MKIDHSMDPYDFFGWYYWRERHKPRARCWVCGRILLSNAVPMDDEILTYVHPACWEPRAQDLDDFRPGQDEIELIEAAHDLGIDLSGSLWR